jgi:cell division protein FtsW
MMYVVHPENWKFFVCAGGVAALVAAVIYYVKGLDPTEVAEANFRLARIRAWLEPYEYEQNTAFQSLQGLYAIGSGGVWGKGLGNSIQKLGKIPEPYNDYIFAIICEELGIFGAGLIILLFIYLLYRIYTISQTAEDLLGRMITIGVMSHIALQVILNLMVVTNLFPTTGVTLPFFSYGGTASVFLLIEIGLVLSVNKYSMKKRLDAIREARLD